MSNIDPAFPLIDLHRHLDGSVRIGTILDICAVNNIPLPKNTVEELRPFVQVVEPKPNILELFKKFEWQTKAMVDYDACSRIAYENVEDAVNEGIDYIELRFSPFFMAQTYGLNPQGVVEAVIDGIERGCKDFDIKVNIIGIISRTFGPKKGMRELEALLACKEHIVALDLAGDEINFPGALFIPHFKKAKDAGWYSDPHAGEAAGPNSVWQAINDLHADRIGHAVHAPEDPKLIEYFAEYQIGIESNLSSNVQTSTVSDYYSHPLRFFLEHNIPATINTDDPGISAIDLTYEYNFAAPEAGLDRELIHQAQRNAFKVSFLDNKEKEAFLNKYKK